ncbi:MAG: AAA family ATPase [Candidatus Paceibacterota bacterium]|jgi:exodeoxyribonuclease-5
MEENKEILKQLFNDFAQKQVRENLGENQLQLLTGKIITFNTEQFDGLVKIKQWLKKRDSKFFTLAGYAGTGKAQPLYSKLYTPNGYITMDDVKIGDLVMGSDGKPTKVLNVFPQGIKPMYRVTFSDEFYVDCCEDHLWKVKTFKDRNRQRTFIFKFKKYREYYSILSTKEMIDNVYYIRNDGSVQFNYKIQVNSAVEFNRKELPIDPYLLGVLLGDGGLTQGSVRFTSIDNEIIMKIEKIVNHNYDNLFLKQISNTIGYSISGKKGNKNKLYHDLQELKVTVKSEKKFIPEIYKYSSINDRIAILQGLMDTDGTIDKNGCYISYATVSFKLANDICELAQSLGCVTKINYRPNSFQGCYIISINQTNNFKVFSLNRKQNLVVNKSKYRTPRYISKIEYIKNVEQKCIMVDAKDNLYLTDNFTVTHNSTIIKKVLDTYRYGVVVSAPTHKAKKVVMNTTGMDGQTLHGLLGLRPDVNLDEFNPNDPKFNPIAIPRISDYNWVIIDEASMINQELFNLVIEKTKDTRTNVLYMGDPAQIPPVGEKESAVFTQGTHESHWLTKIERQNDTNPLAFVYDALRNNLNRLDGGFLRKSVMNELGEGVIFTVDKREFRTAILDKFQSPEFREDSDFAKVICWRNETVMASNMVIRKALFGEKTDIIEIGDLLMGYRSIMNDKQNYNIIENSADYTVLEKSDLSENAYNLKGYMIKIKEDLAHGKHKLQDVFIINHIDHDNLHKYAEMHDMYRDMAKANKKLWTKYYDFRRGSMIMVTIDKYRNGLYRPKSEIIAKDFDYGYAITGHKSQGSTYTHVFVLENDINDNWVLKERNQIKYVALTRPSMTATVLTTKIDY